MLRDASVSAPVRYKSSSPADRNSSPGLSCRLFWGSVSSGIVLPQGPRRARYKGPKLRPGGAWGSSRSNHTASADLFPHLRRRIGHRLQFAERRGARHVFHAAIGRGHELVGRDVFQPVADAVGHGVDALDLGIAEVEHAEHDLLA